MLKIGSHVGMKGKDMFLGSAKEAASYSANAFMIFTGAPQNTKRKPIEELNIEQGLAYMEENDILEAIVHAPYIINLGNSINNETFSLAIDFLSMDIQRTEALKSKVLVLHPGAHVGAGADVGIDQIAKGLNEILDKNTNCTIALETMAGKGSEIGRSFEELAAIFDKVIHNDKLSVCLDTCHMHDAGYDIIHDFDGCIEQLDRLIGKDKVAVLHINDSKNPCGASKDRHTNIGHGYIGFDALHRIVHHPDFADVPKILETPYRPSSEDAAKLVPPYKEEILMLRSGIFTESL
ncbi:deoxyribonuclease IV [Kineothrix sp. MB12-C1]|uniref:deoxyribonuclease IV n=1 Tax=Kineothrix sp. MB12-C1 TaxID=3070215 RepID=UPI0027D2701F|nr:deoxyribonuclease IV [Kineothrix sp. MB12-C1]WMC94500.1 deoxyribonuclease IV [Kineothrix sp. MB12-C1]